MAKVLNPFLTNTCSGRLGSTVFQRSRWSTLARVFYVPINPHSDAQSLYRRLHFAKLVSIWQNFDASTIALFQVHAENWYSSASRPSKRSLNGRSVFMRYALNRLLIGLSAPSDCPLSSLCDYFPDLSIAYTSSGFELTFSPAIPENHGIIVRQTRGLWPRNFAPIRGPIVNVLTYADTSPYLLTPPANNGGGPGAAPPFVYNSWIHFHIRAVDYWGRTTEELFFNSHAYL